MTDIRVAQFVDRHVGPDATEQRSMLEVLGLDSLDELVARAVPSAIRDDTLALDPACSEEEALARLRTLATRNRGAHVVAGLGIRRHDHAAGHPAQRARGPRVVHRVHPVPAGDLARPTRGAPELPDHGERPHRDGARQRVAARRGHRSRGSHDAAPSGRCREEHAVLRRRRLPPADHRGRADQGGAARARGRGRRRRTRHRPVGDLRGAAAGAGKQWRGSRSDRADRPRSTHRARSWRLRPTCWHSRSSFRRGSRGRMSSSARRSASAYRSGSADRTPRSSPLATSTSGASRAGSWASRSTPPGAPRSGWPSRPASSTSAGRRRRATSAPHRCSSR